MSSVSVLPRGERLLVSAGLLGAALLAWLYLFYDAHRTNAADMSCACTQTSAVFLLFVMWSVMMMAMMLPSALPMVLTFATVSRNRRQQAAAQDQAAQQQQQQQAAQQQAEADKQQKMETYNRAYAACLEGRGYTVR